MTATIEKAEMTAPSPMTGEVLPTPAFDYTKAKVDEKSRGELQALSAATMTRADLDSIHRNAGVLMSGAEEAIKRLEMAPPVAAH